jgi:hypothetical protein
MRKYILTEKQLEDLLLYKVKLSAYTAGRALNYCYIDEATENSPDWDDQDGCWTVEDYFDLYEQVDDGEDDDEEEDE